MAHNAVVGVVLLAVVTAGGLGLTMSHLSQVSNQETLEPHIPPLSATTTYDRSTEAARITVTDPWNAEFNTRFTVYVEHADGNWTSATLQKDGTRYEDVSWVATAPPRVQEFPLEAGASITVVGDGVDSDGDGTAGVEPTDTVVVVVEFGPVGNETTPGATNVLYEQSAENASAGTIP